MEDGLLKETLTSDPEKLCPLDDIPYSDKELEVWSDSRMTQPVHKQDESNGEQ